MILKILMILLKSSVSCNKHGDLSNQATKDYIFDTERFASFDGETDHIFYIQWLELSRY